MKQRQVRITRQVPSTLIPRSRMMLVFLCMVGLSSIIAIKLFDVQLIQHGEFEERARRQYLNRHVIEPNRGMIFDRQGKRLAANLPNYWSIGVRLAVLEDKNALARQLADVLSMPLNAVKEKLNHRGNFVWIKRKVDRQVARQIRALTRREIEIRRETLRYYPYSKVGGQVIGFVDVDNKGLSGTEGLYDQILSGQAGYEVLQKDARRREILDQGFPRRNPVDGGSVVLSIDINVQAAAEEELEKAVWLHDAAGGMIVVTRPSTGEILAIASYPRYDPNDPGKYEPGNRKNRAITDVFEPGSTFKVVPFAGLFETDYADIDEAVYCENGHWEIADRIIRDAHPFKMLTARQVLARSSNIGTAKLAGRMSRKEFYTVIRDFGFGKETGIEMLGEVRGLLAKPSKWSGVTQSNMAMGHGLAVTALQLAMAYGVIANDGLLLEPMLILSTTDQEGNTEIMEPRLVRRVLRPTTARAMRILLTDAVELGTGKSAEIDGLRVAGKTGTAQKVDLENKCYFQDRFVSSFAGFLPADRPELLAVVIVDDPRNDYAGGVVAAPIFRGVMEKLLVMLPRQEPILSGDEYAMEDEELLGSGRVVVPSLVSMTLDDASDRLERLGLRPVLLGEGEIVFAQGTPPGAALSPGMEVEIMLTECSTKTGVVEVPDLVGLDLREAVAMLSRLGLRARIDGTGVVITQTPSAGTLLTAGSECGILARPAWEESS